MGQVSTKTHGALDYGMAIILLLMPRILQFQNHLITLLTGLAIITFLYSLLTQYEWGILPIIPTRLHLIADCGIGITLCILSFAFKTTALEHNVLLLLGMWGTILALMTPSRSSFERERIQLIRSAASMITGAHVEGNRSHKSI